MIYYHAIFQSNEMMSHRMYYRYFYFDFMMGDDFDKRVFFNDRL